MGSPPRDGARRHPARGAAGRGVAAPIGARPSAVIEAAARILGVRSGADAPAADVRVQRLRPHIATAPGRPRRPASMLRFMLIILIKIDVNLKLLKLGAGDTTMSANAGLDGVVAADTVLSLVDGEAGVWSSGDLRSSSSPVCVASSRHCRSCWQGSCAPLYWRRSPPRSAQRAPRHFPSSRDCARANPLLALTPVEALRALLARLPDRRGRRDGAAPARRPRRLHGGDRTGSSGRTPRAAGSPAGSRRRLPAHESR